MFAAAFLTLSQILLTPCSVQGVAGPTQCGTYRVWENRASKRGRQIDLSIIVLSALSANRKSDPLFVLQGGPGDAPSFNAPFYSRVFENIRQSRDIVLVDLRGTGKSAALTCPELGRPDSAGVLSPDKRRSPSTISMKCDRHLVTGRSISMERRTEHAWRRCTCACIPLLCARCR